MILRKLQKCSEIFDETNKELFGNFKIETPDSLDKDEFFIVGAKAYDYTKTNEVFLKIYEVSNCPLQ